jgi:opacity protein-like surface antigen
MTSRSSDFPLLFVALIALFSADDRTAYAGGKVGIYGIYMTPYGDQAKDYSRGGFGGGIHVVVPVPQLADVLAGVAGVEYVNLLSSKVSAMDPVTSLRVDQETSQGFTRIYLGGQVGGHGNGFLRPHAGVNIALEVYSYSIDLVVPDDYNREQEIRQSLHDESRWVFGYDLTLGLDLNFSNTIALDGGVRYVKSFSVAEQLGAGSVKVFPQYFQVYLGIGASFDMFGRE